MYDFLDYRVEDVMTRNPVSIRAETPLSEVEAIFEKHDFNALPVVDAAGGLVGLLTKLDLLRAFRFTDDKMFPPYDEIMRRPASSVMTRDLATVRPRTPLTRVLEKLLDTGNKSFPVVDEGRLVGMVAREDVLEGLRRAVAGERPWTQPRPAKEG
jgi:CBS domain-containing protein